MNMILSRNGKSGSAQVADAPKMPMIQQNILAFDAVLKGSIEFTGEFLVEGAVEGKIISNSGDVIIRETAKVGADIEGENVSIEGEVKGNLKVSNKCILSNGCVLLGDLISSCVELESGAVFWGKSQVGISPEASKSGKKLEK